MFCLLSCFFFNVTATTEIYTYFNPLSLHDALPISGADVQSLEPRRERPATRNPVHAKRRRPRCPGRIQHEAARQWTSLAHFSPTLRRHCAQVRNPAPRSEEHTSELQSLMRISYAVFCLKKTKIQQPNNKPQQ